MPAPVIGRRPQWVPAATARIDWTHPLAQGLSFFVWASGGRWFGTDVPTAGSNVLDRSSAFGDAVGAADNSTNTASFGINDARFMPLSTTSGFSVAVTGFVPTPGGTRYLVTYEHSGGPGGWGIYVTASLLSAYAVRSSPSGYIDLSGAGGIGGRDTHDVFSFTFSPGSSLLQGWRGGRMVSSTAMANMRTTQNTNPLRIHAGPSNTGSSAANLSSVAIWQRDLSAGEHAMYAADPFCFLTY